MSLEHFKTQVLLLHSEQNTLDLLSTGFNDRYSVHCATSGTEALNTLGDTPIHVIVCAQDLPGMSGLEALREAKKRSPDTIGILLAGTDSSDGLEALVGDQEVFQIIRGHIDPEALNKLVETATKRVRLTAISKSANDTAANMDMPPSISVVEHIVMETAENGSMIISDGNKDLPTLKPERIQASPNVRGHDIDILVLSKDEEFLATIKTSSSGLHGVYHANTPSQAENIVRKHKVGVLVTDAAMVGSNIEVLTQRLRTIVPRLVAIVAGRRDDGELLMDLINRGQVYRFLLKPVSPGRVRLAIEASVKHHLDAADSAFKGKPRTAASPIVKPAKTPPSPPKKTAPKKAAAKKTAAKKPATNGKGQKAGAQQALSNTQQLKPRKSRPMRAPVQAMSPPDTAGLDDVFDDGKDFAETMTNVAASPGKSIAGTSRSRSSHSQEAAGSSGQAASGFSGLTKTPKIIAVAAGLAAIAFGAMWMTRGDRLESDEPGTLQPDLAAAPAAIDEVADTPPQDLLVPVPDTPPLSNDFLLQARDARDAGNIVSPVGANAMEFYVAALSAAPDDEKIAVELKKLTEEVFGIAEIALLENRSPDAARALRLIGLADSSSPRLKFLNVQLEQQQLRNVLDQVRIATDESRFADAAQLLMQAETFAGANTDELDALTEALATARNEQPALTGDERQTAAEQAGAERQAAADASALRAEIERQSAEAATARQAEADRVAAVEAAARQAEIDRIAAAEAAARQAEADRVAAVEATARQAEFNRATAAKAAARQAEADRVAAVEAAARQAETERIAADEATAKKAEAERVAVANAAAKQAETDRIAAEEAIASQAETDRLAAIAAAEQAEAVRAAAAQEAARQAETARVAAANEAAKKAEADRIVAAATAARQAEADRLAAEETVAKQALAAISAVKRVRYVAPKYPRAAQRRNISGWVDLAFTVTTTGDVTDIKILASEPETMFNDSAIRAVGQWGFEPATENNVPVPKRIALRLSFNLQ